MDERNIEMENPDFRIYDEGPDISIHMKIKVNSSTGSYFKSDIYTRAIMHLIEAADTDLWQKNDAELQPDEFYAGILGAVARHYAAEGLLPKGTTLEKAIEILLGDLRFNNRLQDLVPYTLDYGAD